MATRTYEGEGIRVHWDSSRCIHTARCLRAAPRVFDVRRRPWIDVTSADGDAVARAVEACPTGALRYERTDGTPGEQPAVPTVIAPAASGPLVARGALRVAGSADAPAADETRVTLCRCGRSANPPFCDGAHREAGFDDAAAQTVVDTGARERPTVIEALADGPLRVAGALRVLGPDGVPGEQRDSVLLCRCGHSATKPFCDGSHDRTGFEGRAPRVADERAGADSPGAFPENGQVGG